MHWSQASKCTMLKSLSTRMKFALVLNVIPFSTLVGASVVSVGAGAGVRATVGFCRVTPDVAISGTMIVSFSTELTSMPRILAVTELTDS